MNTFVIPDLHGRPQALTELLDSLVFYSPEDRVVSIGDLANAVRESVNGDFESIEIARERNIELILGNHESGYIFKDMGFGGYYEAPEVKHAYRSLFNEGRVVPAVLIGSTLLTHAGVHKYFDFETAADAYEAIIDVWENYSRYADDPSGEVFDFPYGARIPKCLLLDAVSKERGGTSPFGGILWSDWTEPKNKNFSQVVGHTPMKNGPILTTYVNINGLEDRVFHLNIDAAAKVGAAPVGVWLDEDGRHTGFVQAKVNLESVV